ncbi:copper amine oxidase N-terminal domain-containing protein [Peptococcaceae bacterium]|nr:copper amine oxidase N-terminal domain-containing protein [Peptococcaceae bacterium]
MMTYSLRNKTIALTMAIIFTLSLVMMPVGTAFAGEMVKFIGAYKYVEPDDEVEAGSVTVIYDAYPRGVTQVYFEVTLPSGVEFARTPGEGVVGDGVYHAREDTLVEFITSTSTMLQVYIPNAREGWKKKDKDHVKFDFRAENLELDIDDDFRGDLRVNVEVHGFYKGNMVWTERGTITIARVGEKEAIVTAEDPEAVSAGQDREAAKITIKESLPKTLIADPALKRYVEFEIRTDGVKFDRDTRVEDAHLRVTTDEELLEDNTVARIYVTQATTNFAGKIEFTPILDIEPGVTGEIRIRVSGCEENEGRLDETTLTVATVGDARVEIDDVKYNDGIIYAGVNEEELDTEFKIRTIGGEVDFKRGDMITFELSAGKLVTDPNVNPESPRVEVVRYDECAEHEEHYEAFYITVEHDGIDEIEISGLKIKLDADVEPGDLKLRVDGDYGDLGEVVIARIEKPLTATAEEATEVVRDSSMNRVADIVITEAAEGVLDEDITKDIYLQLPEGIIFSKEPEVEVTRGDLELGDIYLMHDNEILRIEIDDGSTKESTITISDIYYTVKPWAAFGDVEVRIGEELEDEEIEREDMFTTVANAKVVGDRDERAVTATFTKGVDGVEIKEGRTMLRVNVLCDIIGLHKSWDPVNRTAYFVRARDGRVVAFPIGRNEIILNGMRVPVDQGAVIINDFTHVPIRHIQKAFGGELHWDDATKTATYTFTK